MPWAVLVTRIALLQVQVHHDPFMIRPVVSIVCLFGNQGAYSCAVITAGYMIWVSP